MSGGLCWNAFLHGGVMILGGFFQKAKSMVPDEVRQIIKTQSTSEYCLLDVRQPAEYEQGHIPGAKLVPLGDLQSNLDKVPADRMTIIYCRSGSRSRSGVGILNGAVFIKLSEEEVRHLEQLASIFEKTL